MLRHIPSAIVLAAALGGCAHAYSPAGPQILAELPDNAPPGECYARVQVPGQAPPTLQGAQWVQMPGPPGSPGPIWCLIPTGPQAVAWDAPRYGFVRVLCEDDITPSRVHGIQRQLHDRGYYQGGFSGQYDAVTAQAVARFQASAGVAHGGYLSFDTLQALEGGVGYDRGYAGPAYGPPGYAQPQYAQPQYAQPQYAQPQYAPPAFGGGYAGSSAYASSYSSGYSTGYTGYPAVAGRVNPCFNPCAPVALPPPPPPAPPPQPCCAVVQPCQVNWCGAVGYGYGGGAYHSTPGYGYGPTPPYAAASAQASASARAGVGYGYGSGAYASARASSSVQSGWLTWGGKPGW